MFAIILICFLAAEQSAKKTALQSPSKQSDQPGEAKNANNTAS